MLFRRTRTREVMEVIARLYDKKSPSEILNVLAQMHRDDPRFSSAVVRVEAGENFFDVLYSEGLIDKETYEYLLSAFENRKVKEFVLSFLRTGRDLSRIVQDLVKQTISPMIALLLHYVVLYIAVYKILGGLELNEKWMAALPSYFSILVAMKENKLYFLLYVLLTLGLVLVVFMFRKKLIPSYRVYEKLKLYLYLYNAIKSGRKIERALSTYKGSFDREKFERLLESGEEVGMAIMDSMTIKPNALERAMLTSALQGSMKDMERNMEDLYEQLVDMTKVSVTKTGTFLNLFALALAGLVIAFVYLGILIPIIRASRMVLGS